MFTVRQLDFDKRQSSSGFSTCMIVGVVVIVFFFMSLPTEPRSKYSYPRDRFVSTMRSFVKGVSARRTKLPYAEVKFPKVGADTFVSLIDTKDKKECTQLFHDTLKLKDIAIVMIFAEWCGHCHSTMPELGGSTKNGQRFAVMANGDNLSDEFMSGDLEWGCGPIEHYPTICVWEKGKLVKVPSIPAAIEMYDQGTKAGAKAGTKAAETPLEEEPRFLIAQRSQTHALAPQNRELQFDSNRTRDLSQAVPETTDVSFLDALF